MGGVRVLFGGNPLIKIELRVILAAKRVHLNLRCGVVRTLGIESAHGSSVRQSGVIPGKVARVIPEFGRPRSFQARVIREIRGQRGFDSHCPPSIRGKR